MSRLRALIYGGLTVAIVEAVETSTFWGLRAGISPWQIFRYISSGILGPPAFDGGLATTILGVAIHFFNAFVIVTLYFLASRKLPTLVRHPVAWGLAYGAGVHLFMQWVVIPLSMAHRSKPTWVGMIHGLISQAVTVGLPSAFFARAALRAGAPPPGHAAVPLMRADA